MLYRLKCLSLVTLVLSLTCSVGVSAKGFVVQHTLAQAATPNSKAEADKLYQQGVQQYRQGYYKNALSTYQQALAIYRQLNDQPGIGQTLNNLGQVYNGLWEYNKALEVLQQALTIRKQLTDRAGEGETLDNIGSAYLGLEQNEKALEIFQQALVIRRAVKDRAGEGVTLSKIGITYSLLKQHPKALELLQQALAIHKKVVDKFSEGFTLFMIGTVYLNMEDYPRALEWCNKALAVHQEIGNRAGEGRTLLQIGLNYSQQDKPDQALQFYQQALLIYRKLGIHAQENQVLQLISGIYFSQDKIDTALEFGQQALVVARTNELRPQLLESLDWLGTLYKIKASFYVARGLYSQAKAEFSRIVELSQEALILARELKNRKLEEADALSNLGYAYIYLNEHQKAIEVLQQAVNIAREIKELATESSALSALKTIYVQLGKQDKQLEVGLRQVEIAREQDDKSSLTNKLMGLANDYDMSGKHQKAVETYQQALAVARQIEIAKLPPVLQANVLEFEFNILEGLSSSYNNLGEYDRATDFAQQSLKYAQTIRRPDLEATALLCLAFLSSITYRDYPKAVELSQRALTIGQQIKEPDLKAQALHQMGDVYKEQGNYQKALDSAEQLLAIAKRLENPGLEQSALNLFADIYYKQGNYRKALEIAQQRLALVRTKLPSYEILALTDLSRINRAVGDTPKAVETAKQALSIARQNQDPRSKAAALLSLTQTYIVRGEYELGIEAAQTALEISRNNKTFYGEVTAAVGLSEIYAALGEYQKVIAVAEPNLTQARKIKNRADEAELLINLGDAYRIIGDYTKANNFIEQGLKIARELKDPRLESIALNSLGYYYTSLNNLKKALELAQQSLKIAQNLKSPPLLISPQFNLGDIYSVLGDYNKAKEFYQQALTTAQQIKNRQSEGIALLAQASTYFAQGEPQKTVDLSQQALTIFQEIKVPRLQAFANRMLSIGYGELGNDAKAISSAQAFLAFTRKTQNPVWEQSALNLLGSLHSLFGRKQDAIDAYQTALAIKTDTQVLGGDSGINAGLAIAYRDLNQPKVAILYYKQAINGIEQVRRNIEGLPPQLQTSFLQATYDFGSLKVSDIYRQLADLLLSQGREAEAQQILELLKVQELNDFASTTRGAKKIATVELSDSEQKIVTQKETLIAFGKQLAECQEKSCLQLSELQARQRQLNKEFYHLVKNLPHSEIDSSRMQAVFDSTDNFIAGADKIVENKPDTVLIYPLVLKDKVRLLWASKGGVFSSKVCHIGEAELSRTVTKYREQVQSPNSDITQVKATSKKLYSCLVKPLEAELKQNKVKNLVFIPDRDINYISLATLFDGEKYLIENYNVFSILNAGLTDITDSLPSQTQSTSVLGLGLSNAVTTPDGVRFAALINVGAELNTIIKENSKDANGFYPGLQFLNQAFNLDALENNLEGKEILHIASHGVFDKDDPQASYIVLGNGDKYPISQIQFLQNLRSVHLVVLSACETAVGGRNQHGIEIQGISSYFLRDKAKAVIASLWLVNDLSTSMLMQEFYKNLAGGKMTKAEALRQAQLSLLSSQAPKARNAGDRGGLIVGEEPGKSPSNQGRKSNFSHPYYWAPFILTGNGF